MTDPIYIPEGLTPSEQFAAVARIRETTDPIHIALAGQRLVIMTSEVFEDLHGTRFHAVRAERDVAREERDRLRADLTRALQERDTIANEHRRALKWIEGMTERASLLFPLTRGKARELPTHALLVEFQRWLVG